MSLKSPKTRFKESPHAKIHADIAINPATIAAFDAALLEMQWRQGTASDMGTAAAQNFMLEGGRKLRDIFMTLSSVDEPIPQSKGDDLPFNEFDKPKK